ncbi:MAG: MBL fold metallo-hydrolase [Oscillospiraceae bacterium]|jgi:glyoxylase-like metal-dependent hydrolase (beta-lactamase superfamily II)|nr:MBL fold metallo-hydrolase [Oscillospiraceae bacterium]
MLEFKTEKLTDRVTRIFAFSTELAYLVEGDEKAALLDTGSGLGSLKECVERLTDKPLVVLLTHGHVDHAMGADEFGEVYMNRKDDYIFAEHGDMAFRKEGLNILAPGLKVGDGDMIPTADVGRFHDMKGGDSFDLGGVTVEVYDCPGHTRGSVVFLIPEERSVLLGDACNYFTFMFGGYSTTITEYEKSLQTLSKALAGRFDTVYLSHGGGNAHKEMIEDVIAVCEDIKNGNTDDVPFEFGGEKGIIAKAILPGGQRADGRKGNIVYNKTRI